MAVMELKSILKPENSAIAGIATVGLVYAIYNLNVGSVVTLQASTANHPAGEASRKKACLVAFATVAALVLVTRDKNIGILGWGTLIVMDLTSRHAIMAHPQTGKMMHPDGNSAYAPAENVYPLYAQGQVG